MSLSKLKQWTATFIKAAEADAFHGVETHLCRLGAPASGRAMAEATALMLAHLDGCYTVEHKRRDFRSLLSKQTYDPKRAEGARYVVTFDIFGRASARLLVDELAELDLASLNWTEWLRYERIGYSRLWISRIDGRPLGKREVVRLSNAVQADFDVDYTDEEVQVTYFPSDYWLEVLVEELDECSALALRYMAIYARVPDLTLLLSHLHDRPTRTRGRSAGDKKATA